MIPLTPHSILGRTPFLLPANFDAFNRAYTPIQDGCARCSTASGFDSTELQGDENMTAQVHIFTPCPDCLGAELCPGCLSPLALSFDQSAMPDVTMPNIPDYETGTATYYTIDTYQYAIGAMPFEGFTCLVCGWQCDPDRFADQYDEPYDDGDYPLPIGY